MLSKDVRTWALIGLTGSRFKGEESLPGTTSHVMIGDGNL